MEYQWLFFNLAILGMLAIDLFVFHKNAHVVSLKESLTWSSIWIGLALLFNCWLYLDRGMEDALSFFTGYLLEKSMSIDNLFVFLLIFRHFAVPPAYTHKVLFWGILGAIVMRIAFIFGGIWLIQTFHPIIYVFGIFLIYAGYKLAKEKETKIEPEKNPIIIFIKKFLPVTHHYHEDHFFIRRNAKLLATPLFIVLVSIEMTDVIFAIDSIPAILAITRDPFIVYTSNIMAILGLRSLYFALAGLIDLFEYLHYGLAAILIFIGFKMLIADIYPIPIFATLIFITLAILLSIIASILLRKEQLKDPIKRKEGDK